MLGTLACPSTSSADGNIDPSTGSNKASCGCHVAGASSSKAARCTTEPCTVRREGISSHQKAAPSSRALKDVETEDDDDVEDLDDKSFMGINAKDLKILL
jgi:hypothetical protein